MPYGLRSIAFVAELIHAPVQHDPRTLQKLHGDLFASAEASYKDFRLVPGGAQLANAAGGLPGSPVSCVNLLPDRVQIREEQTGISREEFAMDRSRVYQRPGRRERKRDAERRVINGVIIARK